MDIITGEKLQFICNHYIGKKSEFNKNNYTYNPNLKKEKILIFEDLKKDFNNKSIIFCYTHLLKDIDELIDKLNFMMNDFVLVFHNSDYNFEKQHLKLLELSKLKKIYTQNMNVYNEKIKPLPIGIANSKWHHGNLSVWNEILSLKINKSNNIYFSFSINTNSKIRGDCYNKIVRKKIPFLKSRNYHKYLRILASYKYSICPEGNGIDTHRFWESLYLKVIPICKRNILVEYFSNYFPIFILDDWNDLNFGFLHNKYNDFNWENYQKLNLDYYKKLLTNLNYNADN
tara:strand:- start:31 stop:888 length:858 start_codon:yes stop_codon:yes gene_type:complete